MKTTFTQQPVLPASRPVTFNSWQRYLQQQLDKINRTKVVSKMDWK